LRAITFSLVVLLAATALAGCADPAPATDTPTPATATTPAAGSDAPSVATFVAKQSAPPGPDAANITYSFEGPQAVRDGWVTIHLMNQAFELHQVAVWKLGGTPYAAFEQGLLHPAANASAPAAGGPQRAGGVGAALPGGNATATILLAPGEYAIVCFVPGPTGEPHTMHGMVRNLTVVKGTGAGAAEPTPDATLTLRDYKFNLSANLTAGRHIIKVVNAGPHPHEAPLVMLAGNATAQDFLAAFAPGAHGPPPVSAAHGAAPLVNGAVQYVTVDLPAGHYAFICFEQDSAESPPHFVLGMVHEFDVA
jgi:hypothetical protein